ncbi:PREDICTED: receptor-type tyrosine-protein phosphatase epsilon-like [Amphimedon queenslandica]|nr:PREDICTED: receptor-type tyrosine-protein phosphatase epsilon-like [Amphimedon queenslandica]|eukprot:XP_019857512.1 PREDICTED: receptor-type tyrosine-protein phosphatase epsilon-like [Amphimedon queenslandica]
MITRKKTGKAPYLLSTTKDINAAKGDDIVLKLCVGGEPRPDVTWFFNNQIIGDDEHYEMSEEDNTLLIHDILPMHAGVYNYTASNLLKSISGQIRVFIEKGRVEEEEEDGIMEAESDMTDHTPKIVFEGNYVKLSEFADHIELLNKSNGGKGFKSEFQRLQNFGHLFSTEVANCSENKKRNRFKTILPYDNNLLTLRPISSRGDCSHSYINASYIDGYKKKHQFIATQGPLPQTLVDFWRLIWQEDICCILMMLSITSDGGIVRCQQYWPDAIGVAAFYGPFKIIVEGINDNKVSEERIIKLSMTSSSSSDNSHKTIHHYLFKCWPDHGVPATPTSTHSFYEQIKMWLDLPPPVLIHCSGGIGVTGMLISIMIGIEQGLSTGGVDVMAIVNKMRSQRMNMIQTEEQYQFVHYVLLEAFYTIGKESITPSNLQLIVKRLGKHDEILNMNRYEAHYKALQVLTVKPNSVLRNFGLSNLPLVRSDLYLPPDEYRVVLNKKTEDFIHASYINGYQEARSFIVAESPTKLTAANFWSMIVKNKCSVIVMLCDIVEMEVDTCYQYWPATYDSERHFDFYRIKHHEMNIDNYYTQTILRVLDTQAGEEQTIILIQLPLSNIVSDELSHTERVGILSAIQEIEKIQRKTGNNPILVHCSDTVSRSGVFCVLYTSIQQMKIEQQVNIYEILYNMRTCKPGLITTPVQYKMVYLLLMRYVEEFEAYGNFEGQKKDTESIYND